MENKQILLRIPATEIFPAEKQLGYQFIKPLPFVDDKEDLHEYTMNNAVKLVYAGKEYFELLTRLINNARETIHLQTYIFDDDETGNQVVDVLIAAAKRNVAVYVLADGYASQSLAGPFAQRLKQSGVHFRFFEPVFRSKYFYFGRRLHHKLVVVDAQYALVGGINISNHYNDMPGKPAWLDFALYAEGEICNELCILCWKTWEGFAPKHKIIFCEKKPIGFYINHEKKCPVRIRRNDWVRNKNQISRSYLEIFKNATSYITLLSSYFLPGRLFLKKIAEAARRGVKIKIVLAGNSDVMLAKHAERYVYRWLFKKNIEIYEYKPTILHGKLAFYDDKWVTAGSYNLNNISAHASIELNIDVHDQQFTETIKQVIDKIIEKDCVPITEEYFKLHTNFFQRTWQKICMNIVRLLFFLFTFYFRQKN